MRLLLLTLLVIPTLAEATLPPQRAIVDRAELRRTPTTPPFATLMLGQAVDLVGAAAGPHQRVRTRGPVRIEGLVPIRALGICATAQAPVRLSSDGDSVGWVPRGRCFRILRQSGDDVVMADQTWGLSFHVEHRFLGTDVPPARRFDPVVAGFVDYRIQPQPMRQRPGAEPYYTVAQGEWPMRSTHEEGEQAFIEILGAEVVLQGWERTTNLYADLFRRRDEIELARQRLARDQRPDADPRRWFTLRRKLQAFLQPARDAVGEIDAGVIVTVNRRTGRWQQVRVEERDREGKPMHTMSALLWVDGTDALEPVSSAFD